jgi:hypothetical protein
VVASVARSELAAESPIGVSAAADEEDVEDVAVGADAVGWGGSTWGGSM